METHQAIEAFAALAQESRLKVFRLLVRQGPSGMAAGDIARDLALLRSFAEQVGKFLSGLRGLGDAP